MFAYVVMWRLHCEAGGRLRVPCGGSLCKATLHLVSVMPKATADTILRILSQISRVAPIACNLFDTAANLNAPSYSRRVIC